MTRFLVASMGGTIFSIAENGDVTPLVRGLGQCFGMAYAPDGMLWSASFDKGLHKVSPDGTAEHVTITSSINAMIGGANGICFGPDGTAYVTCYASGNINAGYVVAVTSDGRSSLLASGLTGPGGIMYDGNRLIVTGYGGYQAALWEISLGGTVTQLLPNASTLPWGMAKTEAGDLLIVNGGSGSSGRVQKLAGGRATTLVASTKLFSALGAVRVGAHLYMAIMNTGKMVRVPVEGMSAAGIENVAFGLGYPSGVVVAQ